MDIVNLKSVDGFEKGGEGGGACDQHSVYRKSCLFYWSLRAQCDALLLTIIPKKELK